MCQLPFLGYFATSQNLTVVKWPLEQSITVESYLRMGWAWLGLDVSLTPPTTRAPLAVLKILITRQRPMRPCAHNSDELCPLQPIQEENPAKVIIIQIPTFFKQSDAVWHREGPRGEGRHRRSTSSHCKGRPPHPPSFSISGRWLLKNPPKHHFSNRFGYKLGEMMFRILQLG